MSEKNKIIKRIKYVENLIEKVWPAVKFLFTENKKKYKYSDKDIFHDIMLEIMLSNRGNYPDFYEYVKWKVKNYSTVKNRVNKWKKERIWEDIWDIITQLFLVEVKVSPIHGRGLFARTYIPKYITFIEYCGERYKENEFYNRFYYNNNDHYLYKKKNIFAFWIKTKNGYEVIDGYNFRNLARLINHSCNPNCSASTYATFEKGLWIYTIKSIKKGEEITINYGGSLKGYKNRPCNCGAKNCLGYRISPKYRKDLKKILKKEKKKKEENE